MKRYAIIVAAGTGSRMNSGLPKQFLILCGKPVLFYSLQAFFKNNFNTKIIVVLAQQEVDRWLSLCAEYKIEIPHEIVIGGATRTESVLNGLNAIKEDGIVAIHDGARPLISNEIIENCFQSAISNGSGIACVKPKDSIRIVSGEENKAIDRDDLRLIQTPQTFTSAIIKNAFLTNGRETSTDDATIAEKAGYKIFLVEGSYLNFKITTPEDLLLAESLLSKNSELL
jgi:2-C-methyl-D-erythritol 4-phosphate cytidylyltransferase